MAKKLTRTVILVLVACLLSACARPVGDLGRAKPGVLHDTILPTVGKLRALIFQEPVSHFNQTDEEVKMHDMAWRFLVAPHSRDWFFNVVVEWQRTRLISGFDASETYNRYYTTLHWERYRSSRVRYNKVSSDIGADIATMPGVFRAICAVEEIDRQRAEAVRSLAIAGPREHKNVYARKHENQEYITWFVRAARYRYNSYSFALKRLLIETPHPEARELDRRLSSLAILVEQAERREFCGGLNNLYGSDTAAKDLRSRMMQSPFTPGPKYRK